MPDKTVPPFHGNISFNAQHAPMGAFMSFTCGHFGTGGGIGVEIGKPAGQNVYVGVKRGGRRAKTPVKCLPFVRTKASGGSAADYDSEHAQPVAMPPSIETYGASEITRRYCWATDTWSTSDFTFTVYTPFGSIPEPGTD